MSNRITPPRSNSSQSGSSPRPKMRSDLRHITDPAVFSAVLFKEKEKRKDNARSHARDKKNRYRPQSHSATTVTDGLESSHQQQSFSRVGEVDKIFVYSDSEEVDISNLVWEPQSLAWMGLTNPLTVKADADILQLAGGMKKSIDDFNLTLGSIKAKVGLDEDTQKTVVSASAVLTDFATVILIVAVVWAVRPNTKNEKILVLIMISGFLLTRLPLKEFFTNSSLFSWLRKEETLEPQSFGIGIDDSLSTVLVTLINTYVCASQGVQIFKPDHFVKTMGNLGRVGGTVTGMIKGMSLVVNYVYSSIDAWYNGTPFFVRTGHAFINAFLQEATEIINAFENKELQNVQSSVDRVKTAIDHGSSLQMKIPGNSEFSGIRVCLLKNLDELTKIRKSLMASNFKFSGIRQEPAVLFLRGAPGTMKSQAMQHISHAINAMTLSGVEFKLYEEQPGSQVYNRQAENIFWDGYAMHNVALFDDVLQARDVQGNPDNEAMNVIRCANIFEYNLHMAELSLKGNTNFRSKFLILNSNMRNIQLESIHEIGAFMRRMDLTYDVCPKPEYCLNSEADVWARRFDTTKFPKWELQDLPPGKEHLLGSTRTHPDMCEYHLMKLDPVAKQFVPSGIIHSFKEVIEQYYKVYLMKRDHYDSYMLTLESTLYDTRNQYYPGETLEKDFKDPLAFDLDMFSMPTDEEGYIDDKVERFSPQSGTGPTQNVEDLDPTTSGLLIREVHIMPDCPVPDHFEINIDQGIHNAMGDDELEQYTLFRNLDPLSVTRFGMPRSLERETMSRLLYLKFHNYYAFDALVSCFIRCGNYWKMISRSKYLPEKIYFGIIMIVVENFVQERYQIDLSEDGGLGWLNHVLPDDAVDPNDLLELYKRTFRMLYFYEGVPLFAPQGGGYSKDVQLKDADAMIDTFDRDIKEQLLQLKARSLNEYLAVTMQIVRMIISGQVRLGCVVLPNDAARAVLEYHSVAPFGLLKEDSISDIILDECFLAYQGSRKSTEPVRMSIIGKARSDLEKLNSQKVSPWLKTVWELYQSCIAFIITDDSGETRLYASQEYRTKIGAVVAAVVGFGGAIKLIRSVILPSIKSFWPDVSGSQSDERHARNPPRSRIGRLIKSKPQNNGGGPTIPQSVSQTNQNLVSIIDMVLRRSSYTLYIPVDVDERVEDKTLVVKIGYCLAVRGRSIMMPHHFVSTVDSKFQEGLIRGDDICKLIRDFTFPTDQQVNYFELTVRELLNGYVEWDAGEKNDIAMIVLPRRFQPSKDIVSHFATEKQHSLYKKVDVVLAIPIYKSREFHATTASFSKNLPIGSDEYEPYEVAEAYSYKAHTSPGDCGSMCYVNDKSSSNIIIAMHIAGITTKEFGLAAKISREFLEAGLALAGEDYSQEDDPALDVLGTDRVPPQMNAVGVAAPGTKVPRRIGKTKLRPSPIKDMAWVSTKAPARLLPFMLDGQYIDPFDIALKKYGTDDVWFDPDMVEAARCSLKDFLFSNSSKDVERRVLTYREAVVGDGPGSEFASIPRGTSAGYPYNCCGDRYGTKKSRFFGIDGDFDFSNPRAEALEQCVMHVIAKAKEGIRLNHVFTDSLKDERRSLEKVRIGKTRMFSGSPTELLIVTRMFFGRFFKWIIVNRIHNGMAIGINEYSSEWHLLATQLEQFGQGSKNIGAGDYEGFDMKAKPAPMQAILDIINEWYDDGQENAKIRSILWLELTNSLHVNRGVFMYWVSSLPSGHPLTALVNCMNNHLLFRMCWYKVFNEAHTFNIYAYLCVLGDDNVYAVRKELIPQFNERVVQNLMKTLGQSYTPEVKDSVFGEALRDLDEVTFLKRRFRKYRGQYVAPLDLETVMDIPNWVKEGPNFIGDCESNVMVALEELTLHGKDVFEFHAKALVKACRNAGISEPECTSFSVLFNRVNEREGIRSSPTSFLSDYGIAGGTKAEPQISNERLQEGRAGLFSLTSRMARWQPQLYPGPRKPHVRLIHRHVVKRIATTHTQGSSSQNGTPDGLSVDNRVQVTRLEADDTRDDVNSSSTTHSTTQGEVVMGQSERRALLDPRMLNSVRTGSAHSVAEFLAKPLLISSGTFSTADALPSYKWSSVVPNDIITVAPFKNKLEGSGAFRGDLHLTLMANGNPFQQGRYKLAWIPTGGAYASDIWRRMHSATINQISQLPGVEFDISCDSEATLVVPHVTVQGWAQNKQGSVLGNSGVVILVPYSPLVAPTGSTTAAYAIYAHFENVEMAVALAPQSGARVKTKIKRKITPSTAEQKSQGMGPIESGLIKVAQTAGKLSGIPLLSSVAGPVAWGAELAARVASVFGWSKPHNSEHVSMVSHYSLAKFTNVDVADNSTRLALTDKNELEQVPGFAGTDMDEMALSYVSSISSYISSTSWSTSQGAGALLLGLPCNPRDYCNVTTQGGVTLTHLTPVAFVSTFFALYRGSLRYTFKIVKTGFHSGRLQFTFSPADPAGVWVQPDITTSVYYHREIIDIREGNEFSFVAPYSSFSQYRSCNGVDKSYGAVYLNVLTPLVAPASVSSSVSVILEVSAADDMEFAVPASTDMNPVIQFNPQSGKNVCELVDGNIGGSTINNDEANARSCIGERILSFRSLIKRFSLYRYSGDGTFAAGTGVLSFMPWTLPVAMVGSTNIATSSPNKTDLITLIGSCYAMTRGSMRFKFVDTSANIVVKYNIRTVQIGASNTYVTPYTWHSSYDSSQMNRSTAIFRTDHSGGAEVEVPFYHRYHSVATADLLTSGVTTVPQVGYDLRTTAPRTRLIVSQYGNTAVDFDVYRAAGDDFSFGLFVSVPPIAGYDSEQIK